MKKSVLFASAAVAAIAVAADAAAVDVELYGQVNKGVMMVDDGQSENFNVVDNDFSSTRIGFKGTQALDNGLTASVALEAELQGNASDSITQAQKDSGTGATSFNERISRVGLAGDFGAVFVGQIHTATNKVAEQDLAGASDVLGSDIEDIGGGTSFLNSANVAQATIGATTDNMDGNGRQDAIRYDSPIVNGFQGRVSVSQGGTADLGVFYSGKVDAFQVKGALGYVNNYDAAPGTVDTIGSRISGSVTAKHDNGLGATVSYGTQENNVAGRDDATALYLKVGYTWDAFEVAADYASHEDVAANNDEVTYMGVAGQYNLGNGVSAAAYYKTFELDRTAVSTQDVDVYGVNMRVKF